MTPAASYPKIKNAKPQPGRKLLVEFETGERTVYDCTPLLQCEAFRILQDESIFRCVHVDLHGYAVIWNDDIDLAESEIWLNGRTAEPSAATDADKPRR